MAQVVFALLIFALLAAVFWAIARMPVRTTRYPELPPAPGSSMEPDPLQGLGFNVLYFVAGGFGTSLYFGGGHALQASGFLGMAVIAAALATIQHRAAADSRGRAAAFWRRWRPMLVSLPAVPWLTTAALADCLAHRGSPTPFDWGMFGLLVVYLLTMSRKVVRTILQPPAGA